MATHRVTVQYPSSVLPATEANRQRVFVFGSSLGASVGQIGGNIGGRVPSIGDKHLDLNHPRIPGTISVSAYSPQKYDTTDLKSEPGMVYQLATAIEKGYIAIQDDTSGIVGQTGIVASMAAAGAGVITVTGLTGMTADSVARPLVISGAANAANNGTFEIVTFNGATSVDIAAGAAPGADVNNGGLTWTENGVPQTRTTLTALL